MKKHILSITSIILFVSVVSVASAATGNSETSYKDTKGHMYSDAIEFLTDVGIVKGYGNGLFMPNVVMNRAEIIKVLTRGSYYKIGGDPFAQGELESYSDHNCFDDVEADQWYTKYICYAQKNDWVVGYDDGFRPADKVSFVEALKMTMEVYGYSEKEGAVWYENYLESAESMDILPPTLTNPDQLVNRGEMAYLLSKIIQYRAEDDVLTPDTPGGTYNPPSPYFPK